MVWTFRRLTVLFALMIIALAVPLSCTAATPGAVGPQVKWTCSTEEQPWASQPGIPLLQAAGVKPAMKLYPKRTLQTIDGFGGCFNELGWKALQKLPAATREQVIKALFDDSGCGFTLARSPIGASDFGASWYSLDDTPGDYALAKFSIERDKNCLIPYIKAAMAYRKNLKVWGSAWSPPAWLKDNNAYKGGALVQDSRTLTTYANYLAMYAESYRKEGVNIYAVHVQNEPNINAVYPSCLWNAPQIRDFVRDYMGPVFQRHKLDAEIWLGTLCDGDFVDVTDVVLSDPKANAFITGVGLQYNGQYQIEDLARLYPTKKIIQSETVCHSGKNDWDDAEDTYLLMLHYLSHGASAYFMWNMVLDESGKSTWDWQQNAMVTADTKSGKAIFNPEFYLMEHFSHFIKPGAKRIDVAGPWTWRLAFENPDGSINLIIGNVGETSIEQSLCVSIADDPRTFTFRIPARSFNTFTIPALK